MFMHGSVEWDWGLRGRRAPVGGMFGLGIYQACVWMMSTCQFHCGGRGGNLWPISYAVCFVGKPHRLWPIWIGINLLCTVQSVQFQTWTTGNMNECQCTNKMLTPHNTNVPPPPSATYDDMQNRARTKAPVTSPLQDCDLEDSQIGVLVVHLSG